jgi:hypothetical protein
MRSERVYVQVGLANGAVVTCVKKVSFDITLSLYPPKSFRLQALVLPNLQYDVIIGRMDMGKHQLIDILSDQLKLWYAQQRNILATPDTLAAMHVISDAVDDDFGTIEVYPHGTEGADADPHDVAEFQGPFSLQEKFAELIELYADIFKDTVSREPARVSPLDLKFVPGAVMPKAMKSKLRIHCKQHEDAIKQQVEELIQLGVIEPFNGEFYSQTLMVKKADDTLRFCIDFRFLNNITVDQKWPLPNINSLLEKVSGHKYYTVMDLTSGYHQCPMTKRAQRLTSFITSIGMYHFTRVPFGLKGAPAYFQKCMVEEVLKGLVGVILEVYIDDVVVYGETPEEILINTQTVFDRFRDKNIHIKKSKCRFGLKEVKYVGHILSAQGYKMSDDRKATILGIARPDTVGKLRTFLGMTGYFRQFILNYAEIVGPLHAMNKLGSKSRPLEWTVNTIASFELLRNAIHGAAQLTNLKEEGQVRLYTDASDYAIGAHLVQVDQDGIEQTISFASKLLNATQRNWSVTDKEMFAVIMAITKFHLFIGGRPFTIMIDHRNLQFWKTSSASPKVERWRQLIASYNHVYEFLPGTKNVVADALSRLFDVPPTDSIAAIKDNATSTSSSKAPPKRKGGSANPAEKTVRFAAPAVKKNKFDLKSFHEGAHGHYRIDNTMKKLRAAGIEQEGLRKQVEEFIASCPVCQVRAVKRPLQGHQFSLESSRPNEMISMDAAGPFDEDRFGYKYVLVLIDNMSKFTKLYPLRSVNAEDCAATLVHYLCTEGLPAHIHSDKGTQFVNSVIDELFRFIGIRHTKSTPYSHEENGIVERSIRDVRDKLQAFILEEDSAANWSFHLPLVERLMNTKINDRMGFTPAALKFGYPTALEIPPFDVSIYAEAPVFTNAGEYMASLTTFQQSLINSHQASLDLTHAKIQDDGNASRGFDTFKAGDLILVDSEQRLKSNLMSTRLLGPYEVRHQVGSIVTYEDHSTDSRKALVKDRHVSQCHHYVGRNSVAVEIASARAKSNTYVVESIQSHRFKKVGKNGKPLGAPEFLVKWKDYSEPSWEPLKTLARNIEFVRYAREQSDLKDFIPKGIVI